MTLGLEAVAKQAPTVSFLHVFPGAVKTNIARDMKGLTGLILGGLFSITATYVKPEEVGERHLLYMTSGMYAPKEGDAAGVMVKGIEKARGTDGKVGSGVYSVQQDNESADVKVETLMAGLRDEGLMEKVWNHTESEFKRIVG